jgi:hypothetical protein
MPYSVALLGLLQKVHWNVVHVWQLVLLCPVTNRIEVSTLVDSVEVNECFWSFAFWLIPHLTEDANVYGTHQLLAQDVEAVCWRWYQWRVNHCF